MKKIVLFICTLCLFACSTPEKDLYQYNILFTNNSTVPLNIKIYNRNNSLELDELLTTGKSSSPIQRSNKAFGGFNATVDSIVFTFSNGKGYKCIDVTGIVGNECFLSKPSPLTDNEAAFVKEGNSYYYIITEDDFSNAFDL